MHKSLLISLPPELCNQLCGYLDPESVTNLFKANHALSHKLKNLGGLRDLCLPFPSSSQIKFWPRRYLSTFTNLRSLYFSLEGASKSTYFTMPLKAEDVKALPRGLEHLTLAIELDIQSRVLVDLPPKLLTLSLPSAPRISGACIPLLPRSIVRLELPKAYLIADSDVPHLPPGLTSLNLATAAISGAGLALLPVSLLHLNLEKNELLTGDDLGSLPPYLKGLKLIRALRYATDEQLALLPGSITELALSHNTIFSDRGLANLPASLKVFNSAWNPNPSAKAYGLLPRVLEHLRTSWPNTTDHSMGLLPSSLISLRLDSTLITDACFEILPSTLTSLILGSTTLITDAGIGKITIPLKHLGIQSSSLTPDVSRLLPQSLTSFAFNKASFDDQLEMLHVEYLPRNLLSLHLDDNPHMTEEVLCRLPRSVTSFSAAQLVLTSPSTLKYLPPNITRLRLKGSNAVDTSVWRYMPKGIRFLYLEGAVFDHRDVKLFPRNLEELTATIVSSDASLVSQPAEEEAKKRNQRSRYTPVPYTAPIYGGRREIDPRNWGFDTPESLTFVRSATSVHAKQVHKSGRVWNCLSSRHTSAQTHEAERARNAPNLWW